MYRVAYVIVFILILTTSFPTKATEHKNLVNVLIGKHLIDVKFPKKNHSLRLKTKKIKLNQFKLNVNNIQDSNLGTFVANISEDTTSKDSPFFSSNKALANLNSVHLKKSNNLNFYLNEMEKLNIDEISWYEINFKKLSERKINFFLTFIIPVFTFTKSSGKQLFKYEKKLCTLHSKQKLNCTEVSTHSVGPYANKNNRIINFDSAEEFNLLVNWLVYNDLKSLYKHKPPLK